MPHASALSCLFNNLEQKCAEVGKQPQQSAPQKVNQTYPLAFMPLPELESRRKQVLQRQLEKLELLTPFDSYLQCCEEIRKEKADLFYQEDKKSKINRSNDGSEKTLEERNYSPPYF